MQPAIRWVGRLLVGVAAMSVAGQTVAQPLGEPGMVEVAVEVELTCPSCAQGLERRLSRLDYVARVEIQSEEGRIVLGLEPGTSVSLMAVRDVIRNAGFTPTVFGLTAVGRISETNTVTALVLPDDSAFVLVGDRVGALGAAAGLAGLDLPAKATKLESRATSTTAKIDAWVLPFLNVYGVAGYVDGETSASGFSLQPLTSPPIPAANLPAINAGIAGLSPYLPNSFSIAYSGPVYGVGVTLAAGYNQFFASVDANYTESDLDIGDSTIEAFVISPRVGITGELGGLNGSLYVGAMYQDIDENQNGTVIFPIGVAKVPVDYKVISQPEDEWNYLVGANLKAGESWNYGIEVGFSKRTHVMATLNYRF